MASHSGAILGGFLRFPETTQNSTTAKSATLVIMGGAEMKYALFGKERYNPFLVNKW